MVPMRSTTLHASDANSSGDVSPIQVLFTVAPPAATPFLFTGFEARLLLTRSAEHYHLHTRPATDCACHEFELVRVEPLAAPLTRFSDGDRVREHS
jgi:hypothetical protein